MTTSIANTSRSRLSRLISLLGIALLGLAVWVLHYQISRHRYEDVMAAFAKLPVQRAMAAVILTFLTYWIMTGYDQLAMRYINRAIPYRKVGFAAFVGYAISNSIGHSFLTGGSVRFRLYSGWGLSAIEIAKVVAFSHVTFYLGMLMLIGLACMTDTLMISEMSHAPPEVIKPVGAGMLGIVLIYLAWVSQRRQPMNIGRWEFPVPSIGLSLAQLVVATLDLALTATVLYALLPQMPGMSFAAFLGAFMVAQVIGVGSQVPGGLGVFETIMLHVLTPRVSPADALGAMLAFRVIYFIVPLALAAAILGLYEWRTGRRSQ